MQRWGLELPGWSGLRQSHSWYEVLLLQHMAQIIMTHLFVEIYSCLLSYQISMPSPEIVLKAFGLAYIAGTQRTCGKGYCIYKVSVFTSSETQDDCCWSYCASSTLTLNEHRPQTLSDSCMTVESSAKTTTLTYMYIYHFKLAISKKLWIDLFIVFSDWVVSVEFFCCTIYKTFLSLSFLHGLICISLLWWWTLADLISDKYWINCGKYTFLQLQCCHHVN